MDFFSAKNQFGFIKGINVFKRKTQNINIIEVNVSLSTKFCTTITTTKYSSPK